jgi:hypothetical protein
MDLNGDIGLSRFELRPRRAGELMDVAFRLTRFAIRTMWPLLLGVLVPISLVSATQVAALRDSLEPERINDVNRVNDSSSAQSGLSVLFLIGILVLLLAMIPAMYSAHMGTPIGLGQSLKRGLRRGPVALLYAIVAFIAFSLLMIPFVIALGIAAVILVRIGSVAGGVGAAISVIIITVGFIVALLGIASRFQLGFVALVVEGVGPIEALKRGWTLSRGRWMHFGAVQGAMLIIAYIAVGVVGGIGFLAVRNLEGSFAIAAGYFVIYLLFTMWWNTMYTGLGVSMYVDSRVRNEALDLGQLSAQFSSAPTLLG